MLPDDWNRERLLQLSNDVLARYAIPVEVCAITDADGAPVWDVRVGGSLEAALERMHVLQRRIVARPWAPSRHEALFMFVSQWVEWIAVGGYQDPEHDEIMDMMGGWATAYVALAPGYFS